MAKMFPSHPNQRGVCSDSYEVDALIVVEGEIPKELRVSFQKWPKPQFSPRGDYHWFGGDA